MLAHQVILNDRIEGYSLSQIASQRFLGTAKEVSNRIPEGISSESHNSPKELLHLELARLDEIHRLYWHDAISGNVKAANLIEANISNRCKIISRIENIKSQEIPAQDIGQDLKEMMAEINFYFTHKDDFLKFVESLKPAWVQLEFSAA